MEDTPGFELSWGPWRMHGVLGLFVNFTALLFLSIIIFFSFSPAQATVNATNMNYCVLITGSIVLFSAIWYTLLGKRIFKGPIVDASTSQ